MPPGWKGVLLGNTVTATTEVLDMGTGPTVSDTATRNW